MNSTTDILRTQLVCVAFAALLLRWAVACFIARKFSRPVFAISRQSAKIADGDVDVTFDEGFCSEIDELSSTLDHTAVELSKVERLRREFIANISHDLRAPLTRVKACAEMIRDISGDDREKREAHLAITSGEMGRLTALVNDLLDLSTIQSGNETWKFKASILAA